MLKLQWFQFTFLKGYTPNTDMDLHTTVLLCTHSVYTALSVSIQGRVHTCLSAQTMHTLAALWTQSINWSLVSYNSVLYTFGFWTTMCQHGLLRSSDWHFNYSLTFY